jgi:hypothetical protein
MFSLVGKVQNRLMRIAWISMIAVTVNCLRGSFAWPQETINLPDCDQVECTKLSHFEVIHPVTGSANFPFPVAGLQPPIHRGIECVNQVHRIVNMCVPGQLLEHQLIHVDTERLMIPPSVHVDSDSGRSCVHLTLTAYPNHLNPLTPGGSDYPCEARAWQKVDLLIRYSSAPPRH